MFRCNKNLEANLLYYVKERLDFGEFSLLGREGGFGGPGELPIEIVQIPLCTGEFPKDRLYDIEWAIYECDIDRIRLYSVWMKIYLAALYVYCNKVRQWGVSVESEYYLMAIEEVIGEGGEVVDVFLGFIEWLWEVVKPDVGYEDYFCLLSWVMLMRSAESTNSELFDKVVMMLKGKGFGAGDMEALSVAEGWQARWLQLSDRLDPGHRYDRSDYERIIYGV